MGLQVQDYTKTAVTKTDRNDLTPTEEGAKLVHIKEENGSVFATGPEECKNDREMDSLLQKYGWETGHYKNSKITATGVTSMLGILGGFITWAALDCADKKAVLPGLAVACGIIGGGIAVINNIFKNKKIKCKEKYENLMSERAVQIQKENAEAKAAHKVNRQRLLEELNINEDELDDKWKDIDIPRCEICGSLCSADGELEAGMTSDDADDIPRFYHSDIDDDGELNEFEIMRNLIKESNEELTEEELLKETLDAYTYYCVNTALLDKESDVNTKIALIKQYRELLDSPGKLNTFIENEKINSEKRLKKFEQEMKAAEARRRRAQSQQCSSDVYFDNPYNTQTEVFAPRESGPNQREWYVRRTEKYPDGSYRTIMHKHIYPHMNQSRIVIVKYNNRGREVQRYDFYSSNMNHDANI